MTTEINIKREGNPMEFDTLKIKNESPFCSSKLMQFESILCDLVSLCGIG